MAVTQSPAEYARAFDERVAAVLPPAARRVEAFSARLEKAGLSPDELTSVEALDRLPVLSKDDLIDLQNASPPFGGMLADGAAPRRLFQSPGPMYEPEMGSEDGWRWAPALAAAGFEAGDVVLNAFSYHLSSAGAMFEDAALALGCSVLPGGVGNLDLQARACLDLGVGAYIGLPSYLKSLVEKTEALAGAEGREWRLRRAFVTAEPLPPSLRGWLSEHVGVVRQGYGTAEAGNLGFECEAESGLHSPADALVQICDLATGRALWDGAEGQIVVTVFSESYPLVRFGTGDLSAFVLEPCSCGLETPRIAGWLGRVGEAVKVRGMFLHPRQVQKVMDGLEGVDGYRFVVGRDEHRDALRCEVLLARGVVEEEVISRVRDGVRSGLRFDADVVAVDSLKPGESPLVDERTWE